MAARRGTLGLAGKSLRVFTAADAAGPMFWRSTTARWAATVASRPATMSRMSIVAKPIGVRTYSQKNGAQEILDSEAWDFRMMADQVDRPQDNVVLVDVREPLELQETGKIPGAVNIPITTAIQSFHVSPEDFADMYGFERPGKDKSLVFYCKAGVRAKAAAGLAKHAGWDKVGVYAGSWLDWDKEGGKVERVKMGEGVQKD